MDVGQILAIGVLIYVCFGFFAIPLIIQAKIGRHNDFIKFLICVLFYPLTLMALFGKYFGKIISEKID